MQFNSSFISNIQEIYGEAGDAWLKELPHSIKQLANLWDFHFIKPMENLSYNFVGLVRMNATAKTSILKIAPKGDILNSEMKWLTCFEKNAPQVYMFDETLNAYLMEHLEPGYPLKTLVKAGNDDGATRIICKIIREIQSQNSAGVTFPHLFDLATALPILEGKFEARLLSKAQTLFYEHTMDRAHDVILHGDLHHDNILKCHSGWKAIDPHGYIGDPAAEVGAMIRNPLDCFPDDRPLPEVIERRLKILTEELPFDAKKIKDWTFCITVLSMAWTVEGHGEVPKLEAEVAAAIDQIKI